MSHTWTSPSSSDIVDNELGLKLDNETLLQYFVRGNSRHFRGGTADSSVALAVGLLVDAANSA